MSTVNTRHVKSAPLNRYKLHFALFAINSVFIFFGDALSEERMQQRHDFIKAEAALKSNKINEYKHLLTRLNGYPLLAYLRYQELRNRLDDEQSLIAFFRRFEGSRYEKLLRKRYLSQLAGTGQWRKFLNFYRDYDNIKLLCSYRLAQYFTGKTTESLQGAQVLWLSGDSRPDECDPLFERLRNSRLFSRDLGWQRFAMALEQGNPGLAKYLLKYLSGQYHRAASFALEVHRVPTLITQCNKRGRSIPVDGWIFSYGIRRMAKNDLVGAIGYWDARNSQYSIDPNTRHRLKQHLAMLSTLRRYPFAYSRFEGLDRQAMNQDARFWQIRSALIAQNWKQVVSSINQLPQDEKSSLKWKYWLARALEANKDKTEASALYNEVARERDYYGFLASDHTGAKYQFSDHPTHLNPLELARLKKTPQYAVIGEFLALGRVTEAKRNWWHIIAGMDRAEKVQAAKVAENWGLYKVAVFTAAKAQYWDDLQLRFPVLFKPQILRISRERSLMPSMLFGLIRQESVFDQNVVSPAGAIGLMQIMPATGKQIARELNQRWRSKQFLFNPDANIRFGSHYLKGLLDRYGNNFAMAAAGYNAGPHRVDRWQPRDKSIAADIWVENIPYRETRKYVRYVLGYTIVYQHLLQSVNRPISHFMPDVGSGFSREQADSVIPKENACP